MIMTSLSLAVVLVALHVLRYEKKKVKLEDNFPDDCHKTFLLLLKKKKKPILMLQSQLLL